MTEMMPGGRVETVCMRHADDEIDVADERGYSRGMICMTDVGKRRVQMESVERMKKKERKSARSLPFNRVAVQLPRKELDMEGTMAG